LIAGHTVLFVTAGQLLGQHRHGAILSEPEDGAGLAKRLRLPHRSNDQCG
jgi:hypothetical protein